MKKLKSISIPTIEIWDEIIDEDAVKEFEKDVKVFIEKHGAEDKRDLSHVIRINTHDIGGDNE